MRSMLLATALAFGLGTAAQAAEITIVTPGFFGLGGVKELAEKYSKETGNKVTVDQEGMGQMIDAVKKASDVVILPNDLMKQAVKDKLIDGSTVKTLGRVDIVMIVPKGAKHPDISTVAKVAAAVKGAKQIAYSNPFTAEKSAQAMKIHDMLQRADFKPNNGKPPAKGNAVVGIKEGADMGFQLKTQINDPAVELVGSVPDQLGLFLDGDIAVSTIAKDKAAATAFINYLKSPASIAYFKSRGADVK